MRINLVMHPDAKYSERVVRTKHERLEPMLLRTQLLGCEGERSGLNHWTGVTQGTACSRADTPGSERQSCEPELNFTGRKTEHKKTSTPAFS